MKKMRMAKAVCTEICTRIGRSLSYSKRKIRTPSLPKNKEGKINIHLGCGRINAPGFINVDAVPFSHIHFIHNVEKLDIFPNNYADLIYSSHLLEHFSYKNAINVLKEWRRVLKEGGVLRLSVPDFSKLLEIYLAEGKNIRTVIEPLMGGQDYVYNFHKSVFDKKFLSELLSSAGFKEIRVWDPNTVELHSFDDWASTPIILNEKEYFISLNIEAIK